MQTSTPSREKMKAYLHGKAAFVLHCRRDMCPHTFGDLRRKWLDGWDVALGMSLAHDRRAATRERIGA